MGYILALIIGLVLGVGVGIICIVTSDDPFD